MPRELKAAVARHGMDPVDEEETIDLLGHRYFRASILTRADAPRIPVSHDELIENAHIAASVRAQAGSLDLDEGVVQTFIGAGENEITLDFSVAKAALALLGPEWPRAVPFEQLHHQSLSFLAQHRRPEPPGARRNLLDAVRFLFEAGQVDVRMREPVCGSDVDNYPIAHRLARWEAQRRQALTTPHHLTVAFNGDTLSLVRMMDGSRSKSELKAVFGAEFVEQQLPVLGRCGLLADRPSVHGDEPAVAGAVIRESRR